MSGEVYHTDGTPTGPRRAFLGWDFEVSRDGRRWRWHACDGRTIAGAGTARTRTGAQVAARLFAAVARWHRPRPAPAHLVITLRSGIRIEEPITAHAVRIHPQVKAPNSLPAGVL